MQLSPKSNFRKISSPQKEILFKLAITLYLLTPHTPVLSPTFLIFPHYCHIHTERTPYFWAPNMWRFFPHQKAVRNPNGGWAVVLSIAPSNAWNTSWESYNLTQFNSILTPSTLRQHQISQVKVSVLQDRPLHFRCHSQAQVLTCASDLPATKAESQSQVQVVTFTSDHLAMNQQFPQSPPWVQLIY